MGWGEFDHFNDWYHCSNAHSGEGGRVAPHLPVLTKKYDPNKLELLIDMTEINCLKNVLVNSGYGYQHFCYLILSRY